jgi:hypothetical protein
MTKDLWTSVDSYSRRTRVEATTIQAVGAKGYDGFTLALCAAVPELRASVTRYWTVTSP